MRSLLASFLALLGLLVSAGHAHPIPDVPVRAFFEANGQCTIQVEVDPRCLKENPDTAASLLNEFLPGMPESNRAAYFEQVKAFVPTTVEFIFEPLGRVVPEFKWEWSGKGGAPLTKPDDVTVLMGTWRTTVPGGLHGYRIRALPEGKLSVLFLNTVQGKPVERMAVLFPGETSFLLDLTNLSATPLTEPVKGAVGVKAKAGDWWSTFGDFFLEGFIHVLPEGLDHILFVLGLFLLCREWRPLLWQISTFTLAHTITLGCATLGWVSVEPRIVEPIIAASIAFIALENIFRPRYTPWRLLIVFVFGLVHGLGFASALKELELPTASLLVGLLGFNVGVEGGQLAVITLAFLVTFWIRSPQMYRRAVVIPGSVAIALMGIWWTFSRIFGAEG